MCNHIWRKVNDVLVCVRCGLERIDGTNKVIFDKKIVNYKQKKRKRR